MALSFFLVWPRLPYPRVAVLVNFINLKNLSNHGKDILPFLGWKFLEPLAGEGQQAYTSTNMYYFSNAVSGR